MNTVGMVCMLAAGLWLIFFLILVRRLRLKRRCTVTAEATCIYRSRIYGRNEPQTPETHGVIEVKWQYEYAGQTYTVTEDAYSAFMAGSPGAVRLLKINPDDPEEFFDDDGIVLLFVFGFMAGVMTLAAIAELLTGA